MLIFLLGCGPDLPEGWEDAEPIADFAQTDCGESPYDGYEVLLSATAAGGGVDLVYDHAHFRCEQEVEGFYRVDGDRLSVLVQPVDMHPSVVAACDCLYTVTMGLPETGAEVEVWRRWDDINDPNDPVSVGTVTVE